MTLTIGQLADYVGVTVRAVRHYHQRGLLPEPDRDASGYRRYGAQAVVNLIRIKALSDSGVPLARIGALLGAGPEEFSRATAEIDEALAARIRDLEQQRRRIAELAAGDRLFLPAEVVDLLDRLRAVGVSDRTIQLERDGWILLSAHSPSQAAQMAREKRTRLDDDEFVRIYVRCDQALGWDPDDPRLDEVADAMAAFAVRRGLAPRQGQDVDPVAMSLLSSQPGGASPTWDRLMRLAGDKGRAAGVQARRPGASQSRSLRPAV
jgi:DNA-binding transcriptional MerR regulator